MILPALKRFIVISFLIITLPIVFVFSARPQWDSVQLVGWSPLLRTPGDWLVQPWDSNLPPTPNKSAQPALQIMQIQIAPTTDPEILKNVPKNSTELAAAGAQALWVQVDREFQDVTSLLSILRPLSLEDQLIIESNNTHITDQLRRKLPRALVVMAPTAIMKWQLILNLYLEPWFEPAGDILVLEPKPAPKELRMAQDFLKRGLRVCRLDADSSASSSKVDYNCHILTGRSKI